MFVLLCSFTKKKTGSIFPAFCHATFLHSYISSGVQLLKCITIGMHLNLVKATWPRINRWPCLVEWKSRNITTCIIQPNTFYKINSYIAIIISDVPPCSLELCVKFSQDILSWSTKIQAIKFTYASQLRYSSLNSATSQASGTFRILSGTINRLRIFSNNSRGWLFLFSHKNWAIISNIALNILF